MRLDKCAWLGLLAVAGLGFVTEVASAGCGGAVAGKPAIAGHSGVSGNGGAGGDGGVAITCGVSAIGINIAPGIAWPGSAPCRAVGGNQRVVGTSNADGGVGGGGS